jgi:hypothetical protein
MNRRTMWVLMAILLGGLLLTTTALTARSESYDLSWWTVDGGGGTLAAPGGYSLAGTAGQADAGSLAGEGYTLSGGFWVGAGPYRIHLPLVLSNA